MLTVPEGYREAMAARRPVHVKMEFPGVTLTDADIDLSVGITITNAFNPDTDIHMGAASARQLSTRIIMTDNAKRIRWDSTFDLSFGVEDGEGGNIWIYYGKFIGQRPRNTTTMQAIDFIAYDEMMRFEENADDWLDQYTSSKSGTTVLSEIGTQVGMNIVATDAISDLLTRTRGNRWTKDNYTFRDLLQNIAEVGGCYCRIGGENMDEVEMVWFDLSSNPRIVTRDETFFEEHSDIYSGIYWDDFDDMTWNEADTKTWDEIMGYYKAQYLFDGVYIPKIDGGIICRYPNNVKTGHIYQFKDNPVPKVTNTVKATIQSNLMAPMLTRLNSIGGRLPMKIECAGDLVTQAGDVIQVELPEETVTMPIFYKTMFWNRFVVDTYEVTAIS